MERIIIIGTGGFAKEVHDLVERCALEDGFVGGDTSPILGFLDENTEKHGTDFFGKRVLGGLDWLKDNKDVSIVIAIGNPNAKENIVSKIESIGEFNYPNIIHPSVSIGNEVRIGKGNIFCHNTIITSDIKIGNFITLNLNCTVGHDSIIHDYVTVAPGANISGNVEIEKGCDLGTNSVIIQGVKIGESSIIGAGAVVIREVPEFTTSVGNPSKVIKHHKE